MESLKSLQIKRNYVLIKIDEDHTEVSLKGPEGQVYAQIEVGITDQTEARHYAITGTVIKTPESLIYRGRELEAFRNKIGFDFGPEQAKDLSMLVKGSLEWEVEMELQEGDKVWFDYIAIISGNTQRKLVNTKEHGWCLLINYDQVFLYERDGERRPANGWLWIKYVYGPRELKNNLVLPDTVDTRIPGVADIVKTGAPVTHFLEARFNVNRPLLKAGTRIYYRKNSDTPIEYTLHQTEGLEGLMKIRPQDVYAVIES